MIRPVTVLQAALIAASLWAVGEWAFNFPYPSPVIKPLLPPKLRWPTQQVMEGVERDDIDPSFKKYFYRDPERQIPAGANLVAPADGRVQAAQFRDGVTFLVIGLSFWDVHVVRTPVAGTVKSVSTEGVFFPRFPTREEVNEQFFLRDKAAPVQQIVTLDTANGEVKVRLITSYWASRIKLWVHPGQHLAKGQRLGRILLGSTVIVEFPGRFALNVKPGQHTTAGETIIHTEESKP
jgi:phosphatidylserine decarboxylase